MKMPTPFAQLTSLRFTALALASIAAVWMLCAPANAQVPGEGQQTQKAAAQQQREQLLKEHEAERTEIVRQRALIEQQRVAEDKLCYQKFSVEGCLADAREKARQKDVPLRARELELNDIERKERAATKLKDIEDKKAKNAAVPMKSQKREDVGKNLPSPTGVGAKPPVDEQAVQAQRQSEAQQRASKQADYQRRHDQSRAHTDQGRAEREAKARAAHEAKLKEAADHKARALKQAQERGKTSAPLPAPAP